MKIINNKNILVSDYIRLIESAGWKVLSNDQHERSLSNSMIVMTACDCSEVVGIARLVGDNATHGLICDVVVLPEYRGMGIGKKLVVGIVDEVYKNLDDGEQFLIELLPENGKRDFYIKCGFKYKPEAMDGMYLWVKKGV